MKQREEAKKTERATEKQETPKFSPKAEEEAKMKPAGLLPELKNTESKPSLAQNSSEDKSLYQNFPPEDSIYYTRIKRRAHRDHFVPVAVEPGL